MCIRDRFPRRDSRRCSPPGERRADLGATLIRDYARVGSGSVVSASTDAGDSAVGVESATESAIRSVTGSATGCVTGSTTRSTTGEVVSAGTLACDWNAAATAVHRLLA